MSVYLEVIWQAVVCFPLIAFLITLPYVIYNYHKYGSVMGMRILIVYSFILYLICVYFLVILPLPARGEMAAMTGPRMQLVPFSFVGDIIREADVTISEPLSWLSLIANRAFFQVVFNVVMTVPFGVYLRYYFGCSLKRTALLTFLLSLFFELTQLSGLYFIYPRNYRLFDVDDLMANTLGGVMGYLMVVPFLKILPTRQEIDAASFRRGQEVSLTRRLLAFFLDFLCAGICMLLVSPFLSGIPGWAWTLFFFGYFMILPMFWRGQTVGKRIMSISVVSANGERARWYQYAARYGSLWAVLCLFPELAGWAADILEGSPGAASVWMIVVSGIVGTGYFFFIAAQMVLLVLHRPLFYERLSGTGQKSTIRTDAHSSARGGDERLDEADDGKISTK